MKVVCYIEEGYATARAISNDLPDEYAETGAILGPPDLTSLDISEKALKALSIDLVNNNLYSAPQLMGNRKTLLMLLDKHKIDKQFLREIISIFQQEYYGE